MFQLPSNLQTGLVEARFVADIIDSSDPDREPEIIPAQGDVLFTASVKFWPAGSADMIIVKTEKVAQIDEDGWMGIRHASDGSFDRGMRMYATDDPDYGIVGWTWTATPRLRDPEGVRLLDAVDPIVFSLPSDGVVDLAKVVRPSDLPPVGIVQSESNAAAAAASAERAVIAVTGIRNTVDDLRQRLDTIEEGGVGGGTVDLSKVVAVRDYVEDIERFKGIKVSPVSYFYPDYYAANQATANWARTLSAIPTVDWVIANPASGSGTAINPDYDEQVKRSRAAGAKVMGYVSTVYGTVAQSVVQAQVQNYVNWYKVDGIFLDEAIHGWDVDSETNIAYYESLYAWIKATFPHLIVTTNPGVNSHPRIVKANDIMVAFEQDAATYLSRPAADIQPAHYLTEPREKFWHMVHGVTNAEQAAQVIAKAKTMHIGHFYMTDALFSGGNPWANLPSQWLWDLQTAAFTAKGEKGDIGTTPTVAVGTVATLAAGSAATVSVGGTQTARTFSFGIPQGAPGTAGAAATVTVAATNTLAAGSAATVTSGGTAQARTLTFGIPQGAAGTPGSNGAPGAPGAALKLLGNKANAAALPTTGNAVNDAWTTDDTGRIWTWSGTAWVDGGPFRGAAGAAGTNATNNKNAIFAIRFIGSAWEYTTLSQATAAGLLSTQTAWFIGGTAMPAWARSGDIWTQA